MKGAFHPHAGEGGGGRLITAKSTTINRRHAIGEVPTEHGWTAKRVVWTLDVDGFVWSKSRDWIGVQTDGDTIWCPANDREVRELLREWNRNHGSK